MRTLFGALVGALLGGAIIAGLTSVCNIQDYWPIVLAGLVAGIAMRMLASSDHVSYLRGALAALATVLAMIGGPLVGAKLISQQKPSIAMVEAPASDAGEDAAESTGEGVDLEVIEPLSAPILNSAKGAIGKQRGDTNPLDTILMVAGCLIAYQVGKGSKSVAKTASEEGAEEGASESVFDSKEEPGQEATEES